MIISLAVQNAEQCSAFLRRFRILALAAMVCGAFLMTNATAQTRASLLDRLDVLESQMNTLQARGIVPSGVGMSRAGVNPTNGAARFEVTLSEIQEELRSLRGKIEEIEHEQQRVTEGFSQFQKEMDLRLAQIESRPTASSNAPVIGNEDIKNEPQSATQAAQEQDSSPAPVFSSAKDHYDEAFKQLNAGDYDIASDLFSRFVERFPKDNLVGNAYYWLGETYYVRQEYQQSAEQFRRGFQAMPKGPKAPDNLLKLSMSLSLLNRSKEACVVLKQLLTKHVGDSRAIERKAIQENNRLQCQ